MAHDTQKPKKKHYGAFLIIAICISAIASYNATHLPHSFSSDAEAAGYIGFVFFLNLMPLVVIVLWIRDAIRRRRAKRSTALTRPTDFQVPR